MTANLECPVCHHPIGVTDEQQAAWSFTGALREAIPGLGSMFLHAGVLLICALVTCDRQAGYGPGVVAEIGELTNVTLVESQEEQLESATAEEADSIDEMLIEIDIAVPEANPVSTAGLGQTLAQLMPSGASGGMLSEIGTPGGGSGGLGQGVSFMGIKAYGNRICVIADSSGSMRGKPLEFVKEEILETVRSLQGAKRFQLIFFSTRSDRFPHEGWRHPGRDLPLLKTFLDQKSAGGGTNPTTAFRDAFELSPPPDIIYFMTDGLFSADVVDAVSAMNQSRPKVQIHAISFMDRSAEALMRKIAESSGGTYNHVAGF